MERHVAYVIKLQEPCTTVGLAMAAFLILPFVERADKIN